MRITKQKPGYSPYKAFGEMFGKKHGDVISLTNAVRDVFLPNEFVYIEIVEDGVLLQPTMDNTAYHLTLSKKHSQMKFAYHYANKILPIPERVKLPIRDNGNGTFLMQIPKNEG